ncbi:MAG: hypothetical protein JF591_04290, partial [Lysobacter sp.]|nr:hypothetical protein [Lysobacter sp.]
DRDTIEQLIVYFSGHGVVNNRQEYWLLSDAPVNAAAAVNIEGNVSLARAGAFEHVVFLSDACRTPTQGVQYGRIIGSDIFPNIEDADLERSVDIFFATSLGAPALEVQQSEQGQKYQAIFTEALLDALNGKVPEAIRDGRVRPRPLKKALPKKVWDKLKASGLSLSTSQTPDARITSEDEAWLASLPPPVPATATPPDIDVIGMTPPDAAAPLSTREVAQLVMEEALRNDSYGRAATTPVEVKTLTGRGVTRVTCADGDTHLGQQGDAVTVSVDTDERQSQALIEFDDGNGVLLPVIAGFVGVLRLHERGLDEVWYEPADEFDASMSREELDYLRQAIIKASSLGVFALESDDADALAVRMQNLKFQDPALAVYAAYAYHDIGQFRRIADMQNYLRYRMDVRLYDLALLSRELLKDAGLAHDVVPALPMLSQGWALTGALSGRIPTELDGLRQQLRPSLWSLYTPEGVQSIRAWMRNSAEKSSHLTLGAMS